MSNIGRHRVVSGYRIRDQFGHARIQATVEWVLPYARALLGAR